MGDVPVPPTVNDESFNRPTISMLIIAETFSKLIFGLSTKYLDPKSPFSSASKAINKTSLFNCSELTAIFSAISSNPAVPEALSSAPLCIASSSGRREPLPSPPNPKWSICAPMIIISSVEPSPRTTPNRFVPLDFFIFKLIVALTLIFKSKETLARLVSNAFCKFFNDVFCGSSCWATSCEI